jgi:hypothetical protein
MRPHDETVGIKPDSSNLRVAALEDWLAMRADNQSVGHELHILRHRSISIVLFVDGS